MAHLTARPGGAAPVRGGRGIRVPRQRHARGPTQLGPVSTPLRTLPVIALGADVVWLSLAVALVVLGSRTVPSLSRAADSSVPPLAVAGPGIVVGCIVAILACGGYSSRILGAAGTEEYLRVVNATFAAAALVGIGCYLARAPLSRGYFLLACGLSTLTVLLGRAVLRGVVRSLRRRGSLQHRVLLVGDHSHTREVADVLSRDPALGFDVVGTLHGPDAGGSTRRSGVTLPNQVRRIATRARSQQADVVFIAGGALDSALEMRRLAWELEHDNVSVVIAPSVTDISPERVRVRPVGGLPLIHLDKPRSRALGRRAKRAFDLVGATLLLLLFAPVIAVAALCVRWHDGGPVLFRQTRIGRDRAAFTVLRFRTMVIGAERQQHSPDTGMDPRVTPPGRWLRRYAIDELPQLVNVLRGEMSLVGPRPPHTQEVAEEDVEMARRLRVRPGMTGLCRVSRASELPPSEAIRLDLYYVDNWSMVQDLSILVRTLGLAIGARSTS